MSEYIALHELDSSWSCNFDEKPFYQWLVAQDAQNKLEGNALVDLARYLRETYGFRKPENVNQFIDPRDLKCLRLTEQFFWDKKLRG